MGYCTAGKISKGRFESSKFGKTIIDVSRIPVKELNTKALNIHRPLIYHCRKDPPPYSSALFRVVSKTHMNIAKCLVILLIYEECANLTPVVYLSYSYLSLARFDCVGSIHKRTIILIVLKHIHTETM